MISISMRGIRKALERTLMFDYVIVIPLRNHRSLEKWKFAQNNSTLLLYVKPCKIIIFLKAQV